MILILAAGASSRMRGGDKLLEPIEGEPQLRRIAKAALETGAAVHVALPADRPLRDGALQGLSLTQLTVPEAHLGMGHVIAASMTALPPGPVLLLLADLPEITAHDLTSILAAAQTHPKNIIRATSQSGRAGHPVLFPAWARAELAQLSGDRGAQMVVQAHAARVLPVALPSDHATTDLDTPEDWAAWRLRTDTPQ